MNPTIPGNFNPGTNEWTADIESWVGLFNTYVDLGTWHCVTPYIGVGVGFASISVLGLKDVNVPNNGVAFGKDNTETNFAWAVYGGLSYDVTPAVTIDRYLDIGDASSGIRTNYLGGTSRDSRSRTSPHKTSCSACAGSLALRPRRCRLRSNKAPNHRLLAKLSARRFDGRFFFEPWRT